MDSTTPKRKLRSVDGNLETTLLDHQSVKDLFDFEPYLTDKVPSRLPIFVSTTLEDDFDAFLHRNLDLEVDRSKLDKVVQVQDLTLDEAGPATKRRRPRRPKSLKRQRENIKNNDPLDDGLYQLYHTRMEKEEKKMANLDKNFILSEFDKFGEQLKMLNVDKYKMIMMKDDEDECATLLHSFLTNPFDDIPRKLQMVTKVNDVRNYKELKLKYKLTIKELNEFVKKHLKLKKIEQELKNEQIEDSDEDEDFEMDVASLRRKRLKQRNVEFGPIWRVFFYNCILIIDPIHPPRIRS